MTRLYTPEEAADIFRVAKTTILRWARNGDIDSYKPNHTTVRFTQAHIDAKLAGSCSAKPKTRPARNPRKSYSS